MNEELPNSLEGNRAAQKEKTERREATENDPLIPSQLRVTSAGGYQTGTSLRARRFSKSPNTLQNSMDPTQQQGHGDRFGTYRPTDAYTYLEDESNTSSLTQTGMSTATNPPNLLQHPQYSQHSRSESGTAERTSRSDRSDQANLPIQHSLQAPKRRHSESHPPLLEIPEEVYAVRKAALQVLKPLTSSWLVVSVGFAITVLLGMARWSQLLPELPFWFILIPSWFSHVGLLWCHVRSAQALSRFISQANDNRQRPDSTDHIDRTEYLPLLQRSLKFGLKTGLLSFCTFIFEVLVYVRIAKGSVSLGSCFVPLWLIVVGGLLDGIICKTQSFLRLLSWILIFSSMLMAVMRVDYGFSQLPWEIIVAPIVVVLSLASLALMYIVYGHQVGYYRLTESQLTAGILYSMSALIMIVLVVVVAEVMPVTTLVAIETRIFVVIMSPLVVCLTGMGAYAVSRDEFGRLLLYGGQAVVHPMKLRWESKGWNSVITKGVTVIPMFGEVSFCPLEKSSGSPELCTCCTCYPYRVDEEVINYPDGGEWQNHPYLAPNSDSGRVAT